MAQLKDKNKTVAEIAIEEYCHRHKERLLAWEESHKSERPPIYFDEKTGVVIWANRKQRREQQKKNVRQMKKRFKEASLSKKSDPSTQSSSDHLMTGEIDAQAQNQSNDGGLREAGV